MGVAAMKKVIAKRWINVGGNWYKKGDKFFAASLTGIADAVEVVADEPEAPAEKPAKAEKKAEEKAEKPAEEPKQETRRRTTRK